ncbi:MAG TPA: hypothetical protein VN903_11765 [Polyangia bacterium]|jgi:hypothetical protein|nr:hypothetical protein [Polyangia bacterium]
MQYKGLRLLNVFLGLWVVVSSALLGHAGSAVAINGWVTGIIIVVTALLEFRLPGFRFVNTAAGVWLVASLFAWPNYSSPAVWNNAFAGAAIALVSLVGPQEADMVSS